MNAVDGPRAATPPLSVAPMMDRTDRHFRWLMRQLSRRTLLYTEMVTAWAVLHGERERLLRFHACEHPIALQLGGDDPVMLAECAAIAEAWGYDEVNLNVGCPSDRVQSGSFGAVLMKDPAKVAGLVSAMRAATALPVTVKHRIGVDELDAYDDMKRFVQVVADAGADRFTVHARKAWLQGLSPKENREIPPLRYDEVWRLKAELPHLPVEINGGIRDLDHALRHLDHVDAVMIGRAATDDPWLFRQADARIFGAEDPGLAADREALVHRLVPYAQAELDEGGRLGPVARHVLTLFQGLPGARRWRRHLSEHAFAGDATPQVLLDALDAMHGSTRSAS